MSYQKTIWENNITPLDETNMNHIEDGIEENSNQLESHTSDIEDLNTNITNANQAIDSLETTVNNNNIEINNKIDTINQNIDTLETTVNDNNTTLTSNLQSLTTTVTELTTHVDTKDIELNAKIDNLQTDVNNKNTTTNERIDNTNIQVDSKLPKQNIDMLNNVNINVVGDSAFLTKTVVNINNNDLTPITQDATEIIQDATENRSGLMTSADVIAIQELRHDVDQLEDKTTRLIYTASTNPTEAEINAFVVDAGYTAPFTGIAVVVDITFHIWHYYSNISAWKDDGVDTTNQFSNENMGLIKGSIEDGKIYANSDATGSVNGWDSLNNKIISNETNISNVVQDLDNYVNKTGDSTIDGDITLKSSSATDNTGIYLHANDGRATFQKGTDIVMINPAQHKIQCGPNGIVTGLADPAENNDAANKHYVDESLVNKANTNADNINTNDYRTKLDINNVDNTSDAQKSYTHKHHGDEITLNLSGNTAGSVDLIDIPKIDKYRADKTAFLPADNIKIERSNDAGITWVEDTECDKEALFNLSGQAFYFTPDASPTLNDYFRVTISAKENCYFTLNQLYFIYNSDGYGCKYDIELSKQQTPNDFYYIKQNLICDGWSGPNTCNFSFMFGDYSAKRYTESVRITFKPTSIYEGGHPSVYDMRFFGGEYWKSISNMAKTDHMYKIQSSNTQNVSFPNKVYVNNSFDDIDRLVYKAELDEKANKNADNIDVQAYKTKLGITGSTQSYLNLTNLPILNTDNSDSQTTNNNEEIKGMISLHKISKTGQSTDLVDSSNLVRQDDLGNVVNTTNRIMNTFGGFRAGNLSQAGAGAGIGSHASAHDGGAIGKNASNGAGFSGGLNAMAGDLNTIQLGAGQNTIEKSLQIYGDNIWDANTHSPNGPLKGYIDTAIDSRAMKSDLDNVINNTRKIVDSQHGFSAGEDSNSLSGGGAVGWGATTTSSGGAIGRNSKSDSGGAIGDQTYTFAGGSIGDGAKSKDGFSGGKNAQVKNFGTSSSPDYIDAIQLGSGTNNDMFSLQIYDDNIYNAETHQPTGHLKEYIDNIFNLMFPIGSARMFNNEEDHSKDFGFTWVKIGTDRALWLDGNGHNAGSLISAGIPNIIGSFVLQGTEDLWSYDGPFSPGAHYNAPAPNGHAGKPDATRVIFDASKYNAIYGNSNTVQPKAYVVAVWVRTA